MTALKWVTTAAGAALVLTDLYDVVRALVVPRPHTSGPVAMLSHGARRLTHGLAGRIRSFSSRDTVLTTLEPMVMLLRLALWLGVGLTGFALVFWGIGTISFGRAFIESGSSVFTLGFATENHPGPEVVVFVASAFGLLVIALQIAYLPALYDAFNRRETLVTMLESRAGTPAWGPELLARHYLVGIEGNLPAFYADWERWSADVSESHTTYPALLYLRSPHPRNSWVVGLTAVLDSAALYLAVCPSVASVEARLCLRMGFTCLRDIARVLRIPHDADPHPDDPITLSFGDFSEALRWLAQAHVPLERSAEEAWPHFRGWRVNYETIAYALADTVFAPPAPWTGRRRHGDIVSETPRRPVDRRPGAPGGDPAEGV